MVSELGFAVRGSGSGIGVWGWGVRVQDVGIRLEGLEVRVPF